MRLAYRVRWGSRGRSKDTTSSNAPDFNARSSAHHPSRAVEGTTTWTLERLHGCGVATPEQSITRVENCFSATQSLTQERPPAPIGA